MTSELHWTPERTPVYNPDVIYWPGENEAGCSVASNARRLGYLMKKAASGQTLLGALVLSLTALFIGCSTTPTPITEELKPLQGHWEGDGAGGKCSITITGNSLVYHNSAGWYNSTVTLPAGTDPQQLHATIKDCWPPSSNAVGTVVFAIFKIEDGTLTLAEDDMSDKPPKTFASALSRYKVRRVQP
jgi:hypothetical protein